MKKQLQNEAVPYLITLFGLLGAGLRWLMYRACVDEKGLLAPWNMPLMLTLGLTAGAAVVTWLSVREPAGSNRYHDNFPRSPAGGICAIAAAAGILALAIGHWRDFNDRLAMLWRIIAAVSIPSLAFTGYCRIRGKRPSFLFHGLVCAFFAVNLANHYRLWSGEPQMADYCFQMFACVGLTLTAYYRTAFDVGLGNRRIYQAVSLMTGFFCMVSVADKGYGLFYLAGGLWAVANLCSLPPRRRHREPIGEDTP